MTNAQNGARVKCWAGPNVGSGIVKNITFANFLGMSAANATFHLWWTIMDASLETNVDKPLIVDQVFLYAPYT